MPTKAQRDLIFKKVGYVPTPKQEKIHDCPARVRLVAGGERGGKSVVGAADMTPRLFEGTLYWLVAADYERTRPEFTYLCEHLTKLGLPFEATKNVDPGTITLPDIGVRIDTKSARDPRRLAAEAPDGIIACEASQLTYEDFLRLRGRIAEKRGWMLLTGTFESSLGWYPELFQRGQAPNKDGLVSFSLPSWDNTFIYPGGRNDPEILALEALYPSDFFLERFGGIPCPPKGRVFPEFQSSIHTGITDLFALDPILPIYLWVDPGYQHFYAVEAVQKKGESFVVVDEVYEKGLVTSEIITICQQKKWWHQVTGGAIDIAATQHQAMPAVAETWLKESGVYLRSQSVKIEDGIELFKTALKVNPLTGRAMLYINAHCLGVISELGGCPNPVDGLSKVYSWKTDREGNIIGTVPDDKNNDACKAITYGLVDAMGAMPLYTPKVSYI